jgi:16S rRNA (uracil1498-N3)-methyltransferase
MCPGALVEGLLPEGEGRRLSMRLESSGGEYRLREESSSGDGESPLSITLLVGLLKADQFDSILRTAPELDVTAVAPVVCERSVPRLAESDIPRKLSRWQRILDEGTYVSGSVFPPKLLPVTSFGDVRWDDLPESRIAAIISPNAGHISRTPPMRGEMVFAVGPEGDWSELEKSVLMEKNFVPVSLGRRTMRASTASIVGCGWFRLASERYFKQL